MQEYSKNISGNKRIAQNAIFLYVRMIVTVLISFYTARVLLQELGIDNYGIYNVVGGIVLIFSSLRGLFSSAIQRYLNFENAENNGEPSKVFSLGMLIHLFLAAIFFILVEVIGGIMLPKLSIPSDRLFPATIVFHFSVLSTIISIITIPYDAVIISREKMDVFAYIAIFEAIGKLSTVYLISILPFDILVNYGLLVLLMSILVYCVYYFYCTKKFPESKFSLLWDKKLFKELSSFAGWNFAGNLAFSLTNEGINLLLNFFGGVTVNAARGISYQIKNVLQKLFGNIMIAYRPQCTILYAQQQYDKFYCLLFQSSKLVFALFSFLCIPLYIFLPIVLKIWLGQIPDYTIGIMRAIFVYMMVRCFHEPIDLVYKSSGYLKKYQLCELLILTLSIPIAYCILKFKLEYYYVFIGMAMVESINLTSILLLAKKQLNFPLLNYIRKVLLPCCCLIITLVFFHVIVALFISIDESFYSLILYGVIDVIVIAVSIYYILLNMTEKHLMINFVCKFFKKSII